MESKQAAEAFAAIAQETRLDVLRLLISRGPSGGGPGEICASLGVPPSTLSFHLAALERAGLVQSTRRGRHIIYAARVMGLRSLLGFLTETCCGSRPEICGDLARLVPDPEKDHHMTPAFNILFLCTHNSARSVMAEAIMTSVGKGRFNAYSAGSDPAHAPLPEVLEKLRALGHDVDGLRSKSWDEFTGPNAPRMDFVIALCDTLVGQTCPDFGDRAVTGNWPLPDPVKFSGNAAERATLMNELYVSLRRRLEIFASLPFSSLDRIAVKARLDEIGVGARV